MNKIGILYICTGPYVVFWKDFFNSFEEKFLPNFEKHYFVFTDAENIYMEEKCNRIHRNELKSMPWPLITLLRFDTFLSIENDLKSFDYLMFSNANMICNSIVYEDEFLPKENKKLFFTSHPGYFRSAVRKVPYDRNKKSLAYIPYNCGENYVIGAMFGGEAKSFLEMSRILKYRIEEDLKKNVIARWHDESHINRYIVNRKDYKLLSPAYCYPVGFDLNFEKKICGVSKQDKFDVNSFKGNYKRNKRKSFDFVKGIIKRVIDKELMLEIRDRIMFRKIDKL